MYWTNQIRTTKRTFKKSEIKCIKPAGGDFPSSRTAYKERNGPYIILPGMVYDAEGGLCCLFFEVDEVLLDQTQ